MRWILGPNLDQAAGGVATEQGALRSIDDFNVLNITKVALPPIMAA